MNRAVLSVAIGGVVGGIAGIGGAIGVCVVSMDIIGARLELPLVITPSSLPLSLTLASKKTSEDEKRIFRFWFFSYPLGIHHITKIMNVATYVLPKAGVVIGAGAGYMVYKIYDRYYPRSTP